MTPRALVLAVLAALLVSACGSNEHSAAPKRFVSRIDNQWFPLAPGTRLVYRGAKDGRPARDVVTVTDRTRVIDGARCTVVRDLLYLDGRLAERTTDWYAQDRAGNVWYFGEATAELDAKGRVKSTEGSWESGVDGAKAGIFMPASPKVGQSGVQEIYKGHAEDHFQVLKLSASKLLTKEWTPLEPGVLDHKHYARGIGTVEEETVRGGNERLILESKSTK